MFFLQKEVLGISFSVVRYKQLLRIAVDCCFLHSQAGLNMPCRALGAGAVNECQGAPWSEKLDGKEIHEAACGLELRGPAVSYTSST